MSYLFYSISFFCVQSPSIFLVKHRKYLWPHYNHVWYLAAQITTGRFGQLRKHAIPPVWFSTWQMVWIFEGWTEISLICLIVLQIAYTWYKWHILSPFVRRKEMITFCPRGRVLALNVSIQICHAITTKIHNGGKAFLKSHFWFLFLTRWAPNKRN